MSAKGKVTAAAVQINDRIIVQVSGDKVTPSSTKTGEGVQVARVIGKTAQMVEGFRRSSRVYSVETSAGTFETGPSQTMWLAPEDAAGVKRAHVEALAVDATWLTEDDAVALIRAATEAPSNPTVIEAEEFTSEERAQLAEDYRTSGALDEAHAEALEMNAGRVDAPNLMTQAADTEIMDQALLALAAERDEEPVELTPASPATETTGSAVVSLLERVWARIREDHPELPDVVIVTGSGLLGSSKWGHFRAEGWKVREEGAALRKHELFLAGEALAKGAHQVLQTMLHEAAHTLAKVRDLKDTSRQNRWHNQTFKKMAEEMGLEHRDSTADKSHGYAFVTLTGATKERYADLLAELDREIRLTCHLPVWLGGADEADDKGGERITGGPGKAEGESKASGSLKLTCACPEPNIIRASRKVADKMVVKCDDCDELFGEK